MELHNRKIRISIGIACVLYLLSVETVFASGVPALVPSHLKPQQEQVPPARQTVIVTTNKGPILGLAAEGVYTYKGIPYTQAPLGDLRFAPPQDKEAWTEVLDCTEYGPISVQQLLYSLPLDNNEQSEDCLTLNIWTPSTPNTSDKLPVYVFIHGGGYGAGTGNEKTFDGTSFAQNGVVTVTFNYRISTLGFFVSQETYNQYGTTGNWGLLDQIKALEWVRDNIAAFGGDPNQVTVGGESAGSWSVSALILSPLAKGLFRSAIMESGTILGLRSYLPSRGNLEKAIEASQAFFDIFGASDTAEGLKELRQVDADILNYLSPFATNRTLQQQAFFYLPVLDGKVLPEAPVTALKEGNYNKVNLLIGVNHDEGSLFAPAAIDNASYKTLAVRMIGKDYAAFMERFPIDENNTVAQRARELITYTWFTSGTKVFLDTLSPHNKVFMYNYNFIAPDDPRAVLGAYHTGELVYVFNTLETKGVGGAENEKLAQEMHTRWINFIKNTDPNVGISPPTATQWPQYDPTKAEVLIFDKEVTTGLLPDKENLDFTVNLFYSNW
jgi:para-nitrobenzyl esterase